MMRCTCALAIAAAATVAQPLAQSGPRWFSAWASAHNVGREVPGLSGGSVRLIVRPTLSGQSLRVKFSNIRGSAPAIFSAAYIGVSSTGAAVAAGTNRRLTFKGATTLTLAPDDMVWSDPVRFDVRAFQRLAISLDVTSASDVSMDTLGLAKNYRADRQIAALCRWLRGHSSERARQHRPRVSDVLARSRRRAVVGGDRDDRRRR